jgi:hypothetical protein
VLSDATYRVKETSRTLEYMTTARPITVSTSDPRWANQSAFPATKSKRQGGPASTTRRIHADLWPWQHPHRCELHRLEILDASVKRHGSLLSPLSPRLACFMSIFWPILTRNDTATSTACGWRPWTGALIARYHKPSRKSNCDIHLKPDALDRDT